MDERLRRSVSKARRTFDGHPVDRDRLFVGYTILDEGPMRAWPEQSKELMQQPPNVRARRLKEILAEAAGATEENEKAAINYLLTWFAQAEAWIAIESIRKG